VTPHRTLRHTTAIAVIAIIALLATATQQYAVLGANDAEISEEAMKFRALGDKAFNDGIYKLAAEFYEKYKEEAGDNPDAVLDANRCLVATYVRSGNAKKAKSVLDELASTHSEQIKKNPKLKGELKYWNGCVLMAENKLEPALATFAELLKTLPQDSELYFQTLDAAATVRTLLGKWDEAEKTCALLEFAGRNTPWREKAAIKKIVAVIMMGNHDLAKNLIASLKTTQDATPKILGCLILLREGKTKQALAAYNQIRKSARTGDPLWFTVAYALAEVLQKEERWKEALSIMDDAILFANNENDRQKALVSIINDAISSNNLELALKTSKRFLETYPDSFMSNDIRYRLARLQARKDNPEKAIKALTKIIDDPEADIDIKIKAAKEAGKIYLSLKRFDDARKTFGYIRINAPEAKTRGEGAFSMAETLYIQGEYKKAAKEFALTAKEFKSWREKALFKEIKSFMNMKDNHNALKTAAIFLEKFKKSPLAGDVMFLMALAMKNSGDSAGAEKTFGSFAAKHPNNQYAPRALFEEGLLALNRNAESNATNAFTRLVEKYPDHPLVPNALYRRLHAFFWRNLDSEAIADVHLLAAKYPNSPFATHARFKLADYYLKRGNPKRAMEILRSIADTRAEKDKKQAAMALYKIADILFKNSKSDNALSTLDELSEKYPDSPLTANGTFLRGEIRTANDEYEKAIPFFKKAATERPKSMLETAAWGRAGDCYFALGWKSPDGSNYLEAMKFYNKIIDKKNIPDSYLDQALYKLGRCEELLGDKGKAVLKYRKVIYRYDFNTVIGEITAASSPWFAKSAIAAAKIYLEKNTPEAGEAAISIYNTLIKAKVKPQEDFKRKIKEIQDKFKLK
jgi:TolA-binding protein